MAVSDQPVTAQGIGYREILIPVIGLSEMTCLNLPDQSASLLSGGNTLQGEPGPFQMQVTHKVSGTKTVFWP